MNTPFSSASELVSEARAAVDPALSACTKSAAQAEQYVRQHPGGTLLVAAGLGIATLLLVRAMTPEPPRNRALRLLEDIQHRLATLAEDGAHAVDKGLGTVGDLHLDHKLDTFSRKLKSLFH